MSRRGSRARETHHGLGLLVAGASLVLVLTGLALQHPAWLGAGALPPTAVAADPATPARLLRVSPGLLEESADGGRSWRDLPLQLVPVRPVALQFAPGGGEAWLLGAVELLVSRDGGTVWQPVDLPDGVDRSTPARSLAVAAAGAPVVVAANQAWIRDDSADGWRALWRVPPTPGDRLRSWARSLHAGHWGPPWVVRLYDAAAILIVAVVGSGLVLGWRRHRRRRRAA